MTKQRSYQFMMKRLLAGKYHSNPVEWNDHDWLYTKSIFSSPYYDGEYGQYSSHYFRCTKCQIECAIESERNYGGIPYTRAILHITNKHPFYNPNDKSGFRSDEDFYDLDHSIPCNQIIKEINK
jgi:hypothetical protein